MNDVPLIKTNSINDINTSLIAIKKQFKQLNEALGLVDIPDVDTSVFVKKSDVVDVVESGNMNPVTSNAVVPVDEVTSGNMHSVTSNAVSEELIKYLSSKEIILTSSVDLNNLNTSGIYVTATDSIGNGCSNKPVSETYTFCLRVLRTPNTTVFQELTDAFSNTYKRTSFNGGSTWLEWLKLN